MIRLFAFAALVTLVGCTGDDDPCLYDRAGTGAEIAQIQYRDPYTGTCQSFGGGYCDEQCGPCPLTDQAQPDWALCYASCEGLAETACKAQSGCRAVFAGAAFYECWGVAQSGPVQGGNCTGLDAQACSRHDDCVAIHAQGTPIGSFMSCAAETNTGDPGSCVGAITCDAAEPACPTGTIAGRRNGCWTGYCIPYADCDQLPACSTLDEPSCISRTDCTPSYHGNNCTCTINGCTCQSWTFDVCDAK
ncbi:MAG TPA: hypothetical protein VIV40_39730 [Kofleriaceae bacterium]